MEYSVKSHSKYSVKSQFGRSNTVPNSIYLFWKIDAFGPSLGIARLPSELLLFLSGAAGVGKFWAHSKPILLCENAHENMIFRYFETVFSHQATEHIRQMIPLDQGDSVSRKMSGLIESRVDWNA